MKRSSEPILLLSVAAWLLECMAAGLGCDASSPVRTTVEPSVPIEEFSAQYAQAYCAQNFRCASAKDIDGRTMQECTGQITEGLDLLTTLINDAQDKARISYNGEKMAICITAVRQMTCDDWKKGVSLWTNQPGACKAAVVPKVDLGGACQEDIECTTGQCTNADSSAEPPVDGKCTKLLGFGASCASGLSCADELYCDEASQQCLARKAAERVCISDEECMTSCNVVTGLCSAYAGCAVAGPSLGSDCGSDLEAAWVTWTAIGIAMLFGRRTRRSLQKAILE